MKKFIIATLALSMITTTAFAKVSVITGASMGLPTNIFHVFSSEPGTVRVDVDVKEVSIDCNESPAEYSYEFFPKTGITVVKKNIPERTTSECSGDSSQTVTSGISFNLEFKENEYRKDVIAPTSSNVTAVEVVD